MPGDPAVAMLGTDAPQAQIESLRKELWLDRPFLVQYGHWLSNTLKGDLGTSVLYHEKISSLFYHRVSITAYLGFFAFLISAVLGIIAGVICGIRRGGALDQLISLLSNVGIGIPVFWLGILCIYLFGLKLHWLPIYGWTSPVEDFWKSTRQAVLPVIMLAVPTVAVIARQTRSSMLEVIHQDYIRTAFSKGLRERVVVMTHALKNALIPIVTLMGLQIRIVIGGSVLVETVFNIPGLGRLLVASALDKDFLVLQGAVLLMGAAVCLANLLVDISYGWLDPRIRFA